MCARRPSPDFFCAYFGCEVYYLQLFYFREEFCNLECFQNFTIYIRRRLTHLFSSPPASSTIKPKHIRHHYSRRRYRRNFRRNSGRKHGSKRSCCRAVYMDRRTGNRCRSEHYGRHEQTEERNISRFHYAHKRLLRRTRKIYGHLLLGFTEHRIRAAYRTGSIRLND